VWCFYFAQREMNDRSLAARARKTCYKVTVRFSMTHFVVLACAFIAHVVVDDDSTSTTPTPHRVVIDEQIAVSTTHLSPLLTDALDVEKTEDETSASELAVKPGAVGTVRADAPEFASAVGAHTARSQSVRRVRAHRARGPPTFG
jgi:hypothetical protein